MSTEMDRRKQRRQRHSNLSLAIEEASSPRRGSLNQDVVWIPPKAKDRRGVEVDEEATVEREERCDSQRRRHTALLDSMDLIVDGKGFLVPRKCKKAADDYTVDNELILFDEQNDKEGNDESSSESSSSSDDSSSDEEPLNSNELSLSSIPYCKLVPDSLDNTEVPQTPGNNRSRNLKSYSTLATEALTRTTIDSKSEIFLSPNSSFNLFQSPRPQKIPETCQVQVHDPWDFISPMPDPSPSGRQRRKPRISPSAKHTSPASSPALSKGQIQSLDTFYIPGITGLNNSATSGTGSTGLTNSATSGTSSTGLNDSATSGTGLNISATSGSSNFSHDSRSRDPASSRNRPIHSSPVISTSRISSASKKIGVPPFLAHKSPSQPTRLALHRHRSDSTANNQSPLVNQASLVRGIQRGQSESAKDSHMHTALRRSSKSSKDRHFVPGNVEEILLRSPNVVSRKGPSVNRYKSPMKTPSSSSRGTSTTTGATLTNSTGHATVDVAPSTEKPLIHLLQDNAAAHHHKRSSAATVSSIETDFNIHVHLVNSSGSDDWNANQIIVDQVPTLNLDDDNDSGDEVSEAGAVVVRTRKVLTSRSSSQKAKQRSRSRSRQHRREKSHN